MFFVPMLFKAWSVVKSFITYFTDKAKVVWMLDLMLI